MKSSRLILLFLLTIICTSVIHGQDTVFKTYNYNLNDNFSKLNFSFDIPKDWIINQENDGTGYFLNCKPTNDSEKVIYDDCFEGLIFRVKYFNNSLDSSLLRIGLYKKSEGFYITHGEKTGLIVTYNLKSVNYTGLYYLLFGNITCKSNGLTKKDGVFDYYYFSNGKQTICIITNGRGLDENVKKKLIDSFKFN
jgi:hypothetical protein